ncbi:putative transcription factor bHLH87-like [Capsicum annuum]|nr:putative transcription factor bHLH87-like [Capsicum annuum]
MIPKQQPSKQRGNRRIAQDITCKLLRLSREREREETKSTAKAKSISSDRPPTLYHSAGDRHADDEVVLKPVPIYIISHESQLPDPFLYPSPKNELVVGLDCDGVDLGRYGALCIVQLAFPDAIYLVDAIHGGKELINACKPALESIFITKVILDCKRDSEALYYQFGIKLHNVMDTQIAYYLIEEQMGKKSAPDGHISFVRLLGDPRYCGISYVEKKEIRSLLKEDPQFWAYRPLSDLMVRAAADDVRFLPYVFHKMMEKLSEQSLWRLAVRGSLCCRCFCISDNELIGQQFLLFQISSMWNEIHWKTRFSPCLMCHPGNW